MTAVRTTPPPPLPVRDRAEAALRERTAAGLSPMLSRLAAERATGMLVRERGTLHLAEGRVVHAESPAAPGLDVLLTAHGTLDAASWRDAVDRAGGRQDAGRLLVDRGRLAAGALELCHLGALFDAAYFALAPSSAPGRFRYGAPRPPAVFDPVPVAEVERATLRRRELLHRIWPDPHIDTAPLTRPDPAAAPDLEDPPDHRTPAARPARAVLPPRQQAVLALVDGVRTAADIARELGRPGFHTLVDIRRLAAAGQVAARPPLAADTPPWTPPAGVAPPPPPPAATPAVPPPGAAPSLAPGCFPPEVTDPDITLLKRLRDALEAL
ncbi:transcriptional regulator [Streptomyces sp. NPDC001595]|uniref:transcriptional regulator n=1 Tax=Streptomyces sp. NPDC001532 TaxID=3154520 RepID=UPI00331B3F68